MGPILLVALSLSFGAAFSSLGQAFDSGSNGSYGPLNITNDSTLNLPPDGIFHCTTIDVASGATLRFRRNPLNTPVYLLATGNVVIQGTIDVSGESTTGTGGAPGGPGGFEGGFGQFAQFPSGDGHGPGGGQANQHGVFGVAYGGNTNVYGDALLMPLIGGSGGSGNGANGGGGGGGAVLIASSTRVTVAGQILARGGSSNAYYGSGGAIRIIAPVVEGSGLVDISAPWPVVASYGRLRIDSPDRYAYRNLHVAGLFSGGQNMVVFAPLNLRLDIVSAGGVAIPEGTSSFVSITLPSGSSTNQVVRVQARGFNGDVPVRVKVVPENGGSLTFDGVILSSSGNPPYADVAVTLVPEVICHIYAWTR